MAVERGGNAPDVVWPLAGPGRWDGGDLVRVLETLVRYRRNGRPARHKPLALVWAIGQLVRGHDRLFEWAEFREPVGELLREFGHRDNRVTPQYPFWHLGSAPALWERHGLTGEPTAADVRSRAGFTARAAELLGDVAVRERALGVLRDVHLAGVDHAALWRRVGLSVDQPRFAVFDGTASATYRREQAWLRRLLVGDVAEARCALCGRLLPVDLLVAAHVKPRARCDPAERGDLRNVAMLACSLGCDRLYELGYLAVDERGAVLVSADDLPELRALAGRVVGAHHERSAGYFAWHREHVFRGRRGRAVGGSR
ncbi:HNH endonuclease [Saccharothrix syringae]|uniref:HNH endonuclease n=1 Tax=Saccharothrix syringae TaxID=103733 RepID=A0A5Q0H8Z5_SACSY|nr:HNH endonuclease [Saccharothrix syringae]QFZ22443.1 HNH endonuclease [Saccharothrix syringae]